MSGKSRLEEISIRSLGVIDNSAIEFGPGLNVLTGETGAGKTMILTAIGLALGGKGDSQLVRHGSGRCIVSATFHSDKNDKNEDYLDEDTLVLSRTIGEDGKSKASAGGITVAASVLADLGDGLIEVHGQSANQKISKAIHQRDLLDQFSGTDGATALEQYQKHLEKYTQTKERIITIKKDLAQREATISALEEFLNAGNRIKPKENEYSEIDNELSRLSSVEALNFAAASALTFLDSEDTGAHLALSQASKNLESVKGKDSQLDNIHSQVSDSLHALNEALSDLRRYVDSLEADPARLEYLQNRKSELAAFIKKYGEGSAGDDEITSIISRLRSARVEITDLKGGEDRIEELEVELSTIKRELLESARMLSKVRHYCADELSIQVTREIQQLSMPHTVFKCSVKSVDFDGPLKESDFQSHGCDEITFEIQNHQGAPFLPIAKSASGGEMSRIMLALEVVLAKSHPVGTYIFDEVDAGVGGKAAIEVGRRLSLLARDSQVIVVTHLPQVAAWAETHFAIEKSSDGTVVSSGVRRIEGDQRIEEIARMLAGIGESESAREHAAELLQLRS